MKAFVVAMMLLTSARVARAAEPDPADELRHHAVRFNVGIFSATGFVGVSYAYVPHEDLELEVGTGWGMTGLQLEAMPKWTPGWGAHRFLLGAGASMGIDRGGYVSYWLNADVGYEHRSDSGRSDYIVVGPTMALGGEMHHFCFIECNDETPQEQAAPDRLKVGFAGPQIRLGFGGTF